MENTSPENMNRRNFLETSLLALFAGVTVTLVGCDDDDNPAGPGGGSIAGSVAGSHSHAVSISKAQLDAGMGVTLTLTGQAHSHQITLSDQEVKDIAAKSRIVQVISTNTESHTHVVTFSP